MKAALLLGIVAACVVFPARSDESDDVADGDTGGSGAGGDASMSGTGGREDGPGGSEATGGSTLGEAGSENGGTGGTMPPVCEEDCKAQGLICDADTLTCVCPPETPDTCPGMRCTNVLHDDAHCGDCDTACPAASVCNGGECSALPEAIYISDHGYPAALVLSGDTLYWSEGSNVLSVAVTGGPVTSLTPGDEQLRSVNKLVLDSVNVYAVDYVDDDTLPMLYRIPRAGGSPERIVTEADRTSITDVAVQDGVLYYTYGNQVKSVPANATDATGTVVATATDPGTTSLFGVAVDGPLLFWSGGGPPSGVEGDLISGGDRRTLGATSIFYIGQDSLTTDGARVYWANDATLHRRVYDASTPQETIASAHGPRITAFAVNATTAYFASSEPYEVNLGDWLEKATFGAKPRGIARHQGVILSLVVGESGVYWPSGNKIMRADL